MFRRLRISLNFTKFIGLIGGAIVLAIVAAGWNSRPALAHTRVEAGPYVIVVGWENEPVIVGERNAIFLQVLEEENPVADDIQVELEATVFYGGRSFLGIPDPSQTEGVFLVEIFPTVRGRYELQLAGTIGETPVDIIVELDEVQPAGALQFPEEQPDPIEMQAQLEETQAQLRTANSIAIAGLVAGILGLGLAAFSLIRRSKS
jgi:hypothetical protein